MKVIDSEIIDFDEALNRVLGHKEMYARWLLDFFNESTLAPVLAAFKSKDYDESHKAVHKLKGTASNLSLTKLADNSRQLDEMVKQRVPFDEMEKMLNEVVLSFNKAEQVYFDNREMLEK